VSHVARCRMRAKSAFEPCVVTAFDDAGTLLFSLVVDAVGEADALKAGLKTTHTP
jgi:hypothetical protein